MQCNQSEDAMHTANIIANKTHQKTIIVLKTIIRQ